MKHVSLAPLTVTSNAREAMNKGLLSSIVSGNLTPGPDEGPGALEPAVEEEELRRSRIWSEVEMKTSVRNIPKKRVSKATFARLKVRMGVGIVY